MHRQNVVVAKTVAPRKCTAIGKPLTGPVATVWKGHAFIRIFRLPCLYLLWPRCSCLITTWLCVLPQFFSFLYADRRRVICNSHQCRRTVLPSFHANKAVSSLNWVRHVRNSDWCLCSTWNGISFDAGIGDKCDSAHTQDDNLQLICICSSTGHRNMLLNCLKKICRCWDDKTGVECDTKLMALEWLIR